MGIARPVMDMYPYAWVFFVPFILVTSFAVLNLFIGVIVNSMGSVSQETDEEDVFQTASVDTKLNMINKDLAQIKSDLQRLNK